MTYSLRVGLVGLTPRRSAQDTPEKNSRNSGKRVVAKALPQFTIASIRVLLRANVISFLRSFLVRFAIASQTTGPPAFMGGAFPPVERLMKHGGIDSW